MLEQSVSKHNNLRDRRMRRILRIIQITILVLAVLALGFGFSIAGVFWDSNRTVFWQAVVNMLLLAVPVLLVAAFLEWRIRKLCVEFDYILSDRTLYIWRITGGRRALWITIPLTELSFLKPYDELSDEERGKLKKVRFACCNVDDPRMTLLEADQAIIRKRSAPVSLLIEPDPELIRVMQRALRENLR